MRFLLPSATALALAASSAAAIELYGGASFGGQYLNYGPVSGNPQTMDPGFVLGASQYWAGPPNWSFGIDGMYTNQGYSTWGPGAELSTLSVMATARYTLPSQSGITPYFGAGLGGIHVEYSDPVSPFLDGTDLIFGYQLEAGVRYQLGAYGAFTALKYQAGFDQAYIQTEYVEYDSLSLIAGIEF